jgi:hypothetical protein
MRALFCRLRRYEMMPVQYVTANPMLCGREFMQKPFILLEQVSRGMDYAITCSDPI